MGTSSRAGRHLSTATALVLLLAVLGAALWLLLGGRWLVVETPSMGTEAPVGSLVQVTPAAVADVQVGDLVTVKPAGSTQTWTHEVSVIHPDGTLGTAGRLSGPDPWRVDDTMLVGRADTVLPGVGWLVKGAPLLLVVAIGVGLVLRRTPSMWRLPLAMLAAAAGLSAVLLVQHPLEGVQQLEFEPQGSGAEGEWVNTGLLPLRVTALEGSDEHVIDTGEVARIAFEEPDERGRFQVRVSPEVPWPLWAGIAGLWVVPAVVDTWRRRPTLAV